MAGEAPHKAIANIKKELDVLKSKTGQTSLNSSVQESIDKLTTSVNSLVELFSQAAEEMKLEEQAEESIQQKLDPLINKVNQIEEENRTIAQSILAVADLVKESQTKPMARPMPPFPKPPEKMAESMPRPINLPQGPPKPMPSGPKLPDFEPKPVMPQGPMPSKMPDFSSPPPFPQAPPSLDRSPPPFPQAPPSLDRSPPPFPQAPPMPSLGRSPESTFPMPPPPNPGYPGFPPLGPSKKKGLLDKIFKR